MEKQCPKCKLFKSTSDFYKDKNRKDGLYFYCKQCHNLNVKKYHQSDKGKVVLKTAREKYAHSDKEKPLSKNNPSQITDTCYENVEIRGLKYL